MPHTPCAFNYHAQITTKLIQMLTAAGISAENIEKVRKYEHTPVNLDEAFAVLVKKGQLTNANVADILADERHASPVARIAQRNGSFDSLVLGPKA